MHTYTTPHVLPRSDAAAMRYCVVSIRYYVFFPLNNAVLKKNHADESSNCYRTRMYIRIGGWIIWLIKYHRTVSRARRTDVRWPHVSSLDKGAGVHRLPSSPPKYLREHVQGLPNRTNVSFYVCSTINYTDYTVLRRPDFMLIRRERYFVPRPMDLLTLHPVFFVFR